jgi:hypothetical protein
MTDGALAETRRMFPFPRDRRRSRFSKKVILNERTQQVIENTRTCPDAIAGSHIELRTRRFPSEKSEFAERTQFVIENKRPQIGFTNSILPPGDVFRGQRSAPPVRQMVVSRPADKHKVMCALTDPLDPVRSRNGQRSLDKTDLCAAPVVRGLGVIVFIRFHPSPAVVLTGLSSRATQ